MQENLEGAVNHALVLPAVGEASNACRKVACKDDVDKELSDVMNKIGKGGLLDRRSMFLEARS